MTDAIYNKQKMMMDAGLELANLLKKIIPTSDFQYLYESFAANEYGEALILLDCIIAEDKPDLGDEILRKIDEIKILNLEIHKLFDDK